VLPEPPLPLFAPVPLLLPALLVEEPTPLLFPALLFAPAALFAPAVLFAPAALFVPFVPWFFPPLLVLLAELPAPPFVACVPPSLDGSPGSPVPPPDFSPPHPTMKRRPNVVATTEREIDMALSLLIKTS
jgi:hypothetical protein